MSANVTDWRARAIESFPSLRDDLNDPEYSLYMLFFELRPMVMEAHEQKDADLRDRIYRFAEWCFAQEDKDLWNAAGVAFYEHLFDVPGSWKDITARLPLKVMEECWTLWNARLSYFKLRRLRILCQARFPQFLPKIDFIETLGIGTVAYRLLPIRVFRAIVRQKPTAKRS